MSDAQMVRVAIDVNRNINVNVNTLTDYQEEPYHF